MYKLCKHSSIRYSQNDATFHQLNALCSVQRMTESQIEKLKALTTYFGVWKPPPTNHTLHYIQYELLPKIT